MDANDNIQMENVLQNILSTNNIMKKDEETNYLEDRYK